MKGGLKRIGRRFGGYLEKRYVHKNTDPAMQQRTKASQEATRWKCLAGIGGGSLGDEP